jgi:hypothetical protein
LGVYIREERGVRAGLNPGRQSIRTHGIPLNAEMGIINGIILVRSCGYLSERPGIEHFSATERSQPGLATSPASIKAVGT